MRPNSTVKSLLQYLSVYCLFILALGGVLRIVNGKWEWPGLIVGGTFGILYTIYRWHKARNRPPTP